MITLAIPNELVEHCHHLTTHRNFGRRATGRNGNHEQQMTGTIGESMIRSLFGKPWMSLADDQYLVENQYLTHPKTTAELIGHMDELILRGL